MINVSELLDLAADLAHAAVEVRTETRQVVSRGALNVKRDWQANARRTAGRHARLYPSSISYDLTPSAMGVKAEIGPDKGRAQGALGNLLEFGSVKNPPHLDGQRAMTAEEPRFIAAAEALAERLLR